MSDIQRIARQAQTQKRKAEAALEKHDYVYINGKAYNLNLSSWSEEERNKFLSLPDNQKLSYLGGRAATAVAAQPPQEISPALAHLGPSAFTTPVPPGPTLLQIQYRGAQLEGPEAVREFVRDYFESQAKQDEHLDFGSRHLAPLTPEQISQRIAASKNVRMPTISPATPYIKQRPEELIKPKYAFIGPPGQEKPVPLNAAAENLDFHELMQSSAPWYIKGMGVLSQISKGFGLLARPAQKVEGFIAENETPSVLGAYTQFALNMVFFGGELLRSGPGIRERYYLNEVNRLRQKADFYEKNGTPWWDKSPGEIRKIADNIERTAPITIQRLRVASDAVYSSWRNLNSAVINAPKTLFRSEMLKPSQAESDRLRAEAFQKFASGEDALPIMIESLKKEMEADPISPMNAYTWVREPDRLEAFLHDMAQAELQNGAPLSEEMIYRLRQYHENPWTEGIVQSIFDPLWLVPQKVWDVPLIALGKMVKAPIELARLWRPFDELVTTITSRTVQSQAQLMRATITDTLNRIGMGQITSEEMVNTMDRLSAVANDISRTPEGLNKEMVFEAARQQVDEAGKLLYPELQNMTYSDFNRLMSAMIPKQGAVDSLLWAKRMNDSIEEARVYAQELARKQVLKDEKTTGKILGQSERVRNAQQLAEEWVRDPNRGGSWIAKDFANKISNSFLDSYRVIAGSSVYSDSISGKILQFLFEKGGKTETFGIRIFGDEFGRRAILTKGTGAAGESFWRGVSTSSAYALYGLLGVANAFKNVWTMFVLSLNPRWPVINYMDSSVRAIVWGGGLFDSITDIAFNMQKRLADELGRVPIELSQNLARGDLAFGETVYSRMIYEDFKPGFNPLAYFKYEAERLKGTKTTFDIAADAIDHMADSPLRRALTGLNNLADGAWRYAKALPGGMSDYNTAIEFTLRLRMFHDEYFRLMEMFEPKFIEKGMDALSPEMQNLARQILRMSEGNPARVRQLAESITKGGGAWSLLIPPEIEKSVLGMSPSARENLIASVNNQIEKLIVSIRRNGREPVAEDLTKFFGDLRKGMIDEFNARAEANFTTRDRSMTPGGGVSSIPDEPKIKLAPEFTTQSEKIKAAGESLRRIGGGKPRPFQTSQNVVDNFTAAIAPFAEVKSPVKGATTHAYQEGNKIIIQLGENIPGMKQKELYDTLLQSTINAFKLHDSELIQSAFTSSREYENILRMFISDPTSALNADEKGFLTIVRQMEENPYYEDMLKKFSGSGFNYEPAYKIYRQHKPIEYLPGWEKELISRAEDEAQRIVPKPASYHIAASNADQSFGKLNQLSTQLQTTDTTLFNEIQTFRDRWGQVRAQYFFYMDHNYPGPLRMSGDARHAAWEMDWAMKTESYSTQSRITNDFLSLYQKDPKAATEYLHNINNNFTDIFLAEHGITVKWDATHEHIIEAYFKNPVVGFRSKRMDRATLDNLQAWMYGKEIENAMASQVMRAKEPYLESITAYFQDAFLHNRKKAEAWSAYINKNARKWNEVTGRPIEEYYQRMGFTTQMPPKEGVIKLGNGAIQKTKDGYIFYGTYQTTFRDMAKENSVMFLDDLREMAKYSTEYAQDYQIIKELLGIKGNRKPTAENYAVFSDQFVKYLENGHGEDISLKRTLEKFGVWLAPLSETGEPMSEDVLSVLQRLSIESKMGIPSSRTETVDRILSEAGVTREEALSALNKGQEELIPIYRATQKSVEEEAKIPYKWGTTKAGITFREGVPGEKSFAYVTQSQLDEAQKWAVAQHLVDHKLQPNVEAAFAEVNRLGIDAFRDQVGFDDAEAFFNKMSIEWKPASEAPGGNITYEGLPRILPTTRKLEDITLNELKGTIGGEDVVGHLQEGFDAWKQQERFAFVSQEAMKDIDTFKSYLRGRIDNNWPGASQVYERWLWETEQMEQAVLDTAMGQITHKTLFPNITQANIGEDIQVWARNSEFMAGQYDAALNMFDQWENYLIELSKNRGLSPALPKVEAENFIRWAELATKNKAELISTIINGGMIEGISVEGAINKVNRIMIDYTYQNNFDRLMRNFFPFWTFPSRSFPFWAQTIITHPELISIYVRLQKMSESFRYQKNMINSKGQALKSYEGYIPIPGISGSNGETLWFNPLAPLSFRYVLDTPSRLGYSIDQNQQNPYDMEPMAVLAKEFFDASNVFGFSLAPWNIFVVKKILHIPDTVLPQLPLTPQTAALTPKWIVPDYIRMGRKILFYGWRDVINPEVQGHDYLVEREILYNTYQKVLDPNLSEDEKTAASQQAHNALGGKYDPNSGLSETEWYIQRRQNPLWKETENNLYKQEYFRNLASMFTGIFVKPYRDNQADFQQLRNQVLLLRSAMNNYYQAELFDLPADPEQINQLYNNFQETPEGWLTRSYTDIGWVADDKERLISDPIERAKALAIKIEQDNIQQARYDALKTLNIQYQQKLTRIPIGSSFEMYKPIYDWYHDSFESIDKQYPSTYERKFGTYRNFHTIQKEIADKWFGELYALRPQWDINKETYMQYQNRLNLWYANAPQVAQQLFPKFLDSQYTNDVLNSLHPDQKAQFGGEQFFRSLLQNSNYRGIQDWRKSNDSVYDAMNAAYEELHWKPFWVAHSNPDGTLKKGYEFDLATADFAEQHPGGPTPDEVYKWIIENYGPTFTTPKEVLYLFNYSGEVTAQQRQEQSWDETKRKQQQIWDILSMPGPGKAQDNLKKAFLALLPKDSSISPDAIEIWYSGDGTMFANDLPKLDIFLKTLTAAAQSINLEPPSREQLQEYIWAKQQNDEFHGYVIDDINKNLGMNLTWGYFSNNVLGVYYNSTMTRADQKAWRGENPNEWNAIRRYNNLKYNVYGNEHPIWAKYYLGGNLPTLAIQPINTVNTTRNTPTPPPIPPRFGGVLTYPIGFKNAAGKTLISEINNYFYNGKPMNPHAMRFLNKLFTNHPEWRNWINGLLNSQ